MIHFALTFSYWWLLLPLAIVLIVIVACVDDDDPWGLKLFLTCAVCLAIFLIALACMVGYFLGHHG